MVTIRSTERLDRVFGFGFRLKIFIAVFLYGSMGCNEGTTRV